MKVSLEQIKDYTKQLLEKDYNKLKENGEFPIEYTYTDLMNFFDDCLQSNMYFVSTTGQLFYNNKVDTYYELNCNGIDIILDKPELIAERVFARRIKERVEEAVIERDLYLDATRAADSMVEATRRCERALNDYPDEEQLELKERTKEIIDENMRVFNQWANRIGYEHKHKEGSIDPEVINNNIAMNNEINWYKDTITKGNIDFEEYISVVKRYNYNPYLMEMLTEIYINNVIKENFNYNALAKLIDFRTTYKMNYKF